MVITNPNILFQTHPNSEVSILATVSGKPIGEIILCPLVLDNKNFDSTVAYMLHLYVTGEIVILPHIEIAKSIMANAWHIWTIEKHNKP